MTIQERKLTMQNKVAEVLCDIIQKKESNLAVALDISDQKHFFKILERIAEHVVIIKTHVDIINEYDYSFIKRLLILKEKYNFLILEDRKFADIGNTVKKQYQEGVFKIIDWADLITAHIFPGPGVIQGLREAWLESQLERGVIIIPQMSSEHNLFTESVREKGVEWANEYCDYVVGFIGSLYSGENEKKGSELEALKREAGASFFIFTPGIQLETSGDNLGQIYMGPKEAVSHGADIIIVGRGITGSDDPERAAVAYKEEGWRAYISR